MSCLSSTFVVLTFLLGSKKLYFGVGLISPIVRLFVRISQVLLVHSSMYEMSDAAFSFFILRLSFSAFESSFDKKMHISSPYPPCFIYSGSDMGIRSVAQNNNAPLVSFLR